ncbi:MAG TPA: type II secretion system F family protein [Propionibacteriaceae bacterium]|nr:type II secretion system F family protein [Propionibacteriaceae bacterium]
MTVLVAALGTALVVAGIIGIVAGVIPSPEPPAGPRRSRWIRRTRLSRRAGTLLAAGGAVGVLVALTTGWVLAAVACPVAAVGLPALLSASDDKARIARLEAMEEWIRSLAGVLTAGVGLEQALIATVRSVPAPIRPEVTRLVARLRARWSTEAALRALADDLDDATGDLIVANLVLGCRRRGTGLADVLASLAESVAADVRARGAIEADRAKPRTTARWVTVITVAVLVVLGMTGDYVAPYRTGPGQLVLALMLAAYGGVLVWMRRMAGGRALPRFIGERAAREAAR